MVLLSDYGCVSLYHKRPENQDYGFVYIEESPQDISEDIESSLYIFVVGDGVSCAQGRKAAETFPPVIKTHMRSLAQELSNHTYDTDINSIKKLIFDALTECFRSVDFMSREENDGQSTLSIAVVYKSWIFTANIGDSPILLYNVDQLINADYQEYDPKHYVLQNLQGSIDRGNIVDNPHPSSVITQSVGFYGRGNLGSYYFDEEQNKYCVETMYDEPFVEYKDEISEDIIRKFISLKASKITSKSILLMGSDGALGAQDLKEYNKYVQEFHDKHTNDMINDIYNQVENISNDNFTLIAAKFYAD